MKKYSGRYTKQFMFSFLLACLACLPETSIQAQNSTVPLVSIDLEKIVNNIQEVPLSMVLEKVDYIPLKVNPESILGARPEICLTKDFIIIYDSYPEETRKISVFDRKTGAFIRNIGRIGNGPEEYRSPLEIYYNSFNNKIYANGNKRIQIYNLDGKFMESFIPPSINEFSRELSEIRLGIDAFLGTDTFVKLLWAEGDLIRDQIVVFNKNREIVTRPAKYSTGEGGLWKKPPVFYSWDNKLYVKASINDTVFNITADKIVPRIVLNSGSHRWPTNLTSSDSDKLPFFFLVLKIYESKNHFFFQYRFAYEKSMNLPFIHLGIYDKKSKKVYYCKNNSSDLVSLPSLVDDINGFMPISPVTVNEDNEMIAILDAMDIVTWKKENPAKASALQSRFPWLKDISEFDNPVIVIGKCKE